MTYQAAAGESPILDGISLRLPRGHAAAIIGPSGCGKSSLLKSIAGLVPTEGKIFWDGRDLSEEEDLYPWEIGYVPQFSIAYEQLTVRENVEQALRLRVRCPLGERLALLEKTLSETGLAEIADRRTSVLSGGQRRRLALAQELVSGPHLLLADEVTSGLDPRSEREITTLLCHVANEHDRLVLNVTHSLAHMHMFDSIVVLHEGRLVYHGAPAYLLHYFGGSSSDEIFPILARRTADAWAKSWQKHRHSYRLEKPGSAVSVSRGVWEEDASPDVSVPISHKDDRRSLGLEQKATSESPATKLSPRRIPGFFTQARLCLARRIKLFARDRRQWVLHAALMFGFPLLVVIFALEGLPAVQNPTMGIDVDVLQQLKEKAEFVVDSSRAGTLVSGLIIFQMVLLALMGANNAAREVAGERLIFEKEKLAGLRPAAYLAGRVVFLALLVAAQSVWMAWFVDSFARFPGDKTAQMMSLLMMNAAITMSSLAISAFSSTPDQASLLSIYLVGFQLPLSGALLALPEVASALTRPFIACYWAWSAFLGTMKDAATDHYDAAARITQTPLSPYALCMWVLGCQVVVMLFVAFGGIRRPRWDNA